MSANIVMTPTRGTCDVSDMRFTVVLYTDTEVSETGEPDRDAVLCSLQDSINEWQPDKDPYWCVACDTEFHNWDAVKAHFEN